MFEWAVASKCRFYGILCGESQLSESIIVQYYYLDFHAKFLRTKQILVHS